MKEAREKQLRLNSVDKALACDNRTELQTLRTKLKSQSPKPS